MKSSNALTVSDTYDWAAEYKSEDPTRGKTIRFNTDGYLVGREKTPLQHGRQYGVISMREGWRRLEANRRPEWLMREAGGPVPEQPHVDESEFVRDLSGKLVSPWRYLRWLYLIDAETGVISTLEIGSAGGQMSLTELGQQISGMRQLKGSEAIPVIELGVQPFKTKYGVKRRPEFIIVGWKGTDKPPLLVLASDTPPDASDPNDDIPF